MKRRSFIKKGLLSMGAIYMSPVMAVIKPIGNVPVPRLEVKTAGVDTFQLPIEATGTYDFKIEWGDEQKNILIQTWVGSNRWITYPLIGQYVRENR